MTDDISFWRIENLKVEARQGNPTAQVGLGMMYQNGTGVDQDDEAAFEWYLKAAEQGDDDAQALLGWMYEIGKGVEKNLEQAKRWYGYSAEQGNKDALHLLDCLICDEIRSET